MGTPAYHKEKSANWYKNNRDLCLARVAYYSSTPFGRAVKLCATARNRAKARGIAFSLDRDDIARRLAAGKCEATGLALDFDGRATKTGKRHSPRSPTLDRIDPRKGYTPDNVQIVCRQYNCAKSEWSDAELVELARAIIRRTLQ